MSVRETLSSSGWSRLAAVLALLAIAWTAYPAWGGNEPTMLGLRHAMVRLLPFMAEPREFADPAHALDIAKNLHTLSALAAHPASPTLKSTDYRHPLGLFAELTGEAERAFKAGHAEQARARLYWALDVCVDCHSRLPGKEVHRFGPSVLPKSLSDFERARVQFAFREFRDANKTFEKIALGYPVNGASWYQAWSAVEHIAAYHLRVRNDPTGAHRAFARLMTNDAFPSFLREDLKVWKETLERWMKKPPPVFGKTKDADVVAYARELMGKHAREPSLMGDRAWQLVFMRASGMLHRLLVERPNTPVAAEAEYLLGICYMSLSRGMFSGLEMGYLKSCLRRKPGDDLAHKCYDLLEQATYFGYSGSSGTRVPADVLKELNALRP